MSVVAGSPPANTAARDSRSETGYPPFRTAEQQPRPRPWSWQGNPMTGLWDRQGQAMDEDTRAAGRRALTPSARRLIMRFGDRRAVVSIACILGLVLTLLGTAVDSHATARLAQSASVDNGIIDLKAQFAAVGDGVTDDTVA